MGFGQDKVSKSKENSVIHLIESSDLVHYGIIPELIGRLHVVATLEPITLEDMVRILLEPKNSIVKPVSKNYLNWTNVILSFEEEALKAIAKKAIERKTGARGFAQLWKRL